MDLVSLFIGAAIGGGVCTAMMFVSFEWMRRTGRYAFHIVPGPPPAKYDKPLAYIAFRGREDEMMIHPSDIDILYPAKYGR